MKKYFLCLTLLIFLFEGNAQKTIQYQQLNLNLATLNLDVDNYDLETKNMVELLKNINSEGTPQMYYNWNKKLSEFYKKKLRVTPKNKRYKIWFKYVNQLLLAGENQLCIREIEHQIKNSKSSY